VDRRGSSSRIRASSTQNGYVLTEGEKHSLWGSIERSLAAATPVTDGPKFSFNSMDVVTLGSNTVLKVNFNREDQRGLTVWTVLGFYSARHVVTVAHGGILGDPNEGIEGLDVIARSFRFE
jgi:hypothetical protein